MSPKSTDKHVGMKKRSREVSPPPSKRRHKRRRREETPPPSRRRHKKKSREETPPPSRRRHKKKSREETPPPLRRRHKKKSREETQRPSASAVELFPPWIELPSDITCNILQRIGAVEILKNAQKVCSTWYTACKNPAMWRAIDMYTDDDDVINLEEICRHALDRSQGQLIEINLDQLFSNEELINHIATRFGNLRRLKLVSYLNLPDGGLTEGMLKKFPKLESLVVAVYTRSFDNTIEMVARTVPLLTSFALKKLYFGRSSLEFDGCTSADDDEANAIARSMPNLRHLQLIESNLTNKGLRAILESCRHLESLVLHRCYFLKLEEESDLVKRMSSQIKDVKCTDCSTPEHLKEINMHDW